MHQLNSRDKFREWVIQFNQVGAGLLFTPCQYRGLTAVIRHLSEEFSLGQSWKVIFPAMWQVYKSNTVLSISVQLLWLTYLKVSTGWFQLQLCIDTFFGRWYESMKSPFTISGQKTLFSFCVMFLSHQTLMRSIFSELQQTKVTHTGGSIFTSGVHIEYLVIKVFFKCLPINPWQR